MKLRTQPEGMHFEDEEREMRELLTALPKFARQATDLPEAFWRRQRIGIRVEMSLQSKPLPLPALAVGMALLLFMGALLTTDMNRAAHEQKRAPQSVEAISDQQLLMKVQYTLQNDVPVALEPAALLAQEITRGNSYYSGGE